MQWEPVNQDSSRAASKAAFGELYGRAVQARRVPTSSSRLDADFLGGIAHPGLPAAGGSVCASGIAYEEGKTPNRLYVVESMPTVTGFKAEHRLALKPSEIGAVCARRWRADGSGRVLNR